MVVVLVVEPVLVLVVAHPASAHLELVVEVRPVVEPHLGAAAHPVVATGLGTVPAMSASVLVDRAATYRPDGAAWIEIPECSEGWNFHQTN